MSGSNLKQEKYISQHGYALQLLFILFGQNLNLKGTFLVILKMLGQILKMACLHFVHSIAVLMRLNFVT